MGNSMVTMEPEDYEEDGEIIVDASSMFPDARKNKVDDANLVYSLAKENPDKMHIDEAIKDVLKAMGKGKDITRLMIPAPPPGSPEANAQANPMEALMGAVKGKQGNANAPDRPDPSGSQPPPGGPATPTPPGSAGGGKSNGHPAPPPMEGQQASMGGVPLV